MKRILYYILLLSTTLYSCHKDHNGNVGPVTKKGTYSVNFNVGFSASTAPFVTNSIKRLASTGTDTLASHVTVIYYMLFDSTGTAVRRITQASTDTSFGTITDKIASGTYTVALIAGNGNLNEVDLLTDGTIRPMIDYFGYINADGKFGPWQDTFFKTFSITVSNTSANYNVSLDRIVAQLQVNIQDTIPVGATTLSVKVKSDYENFYIQENTPYGASEAPTFKLTGLVAGATNTLISADVINTITPFSVEITCTNASGSVVYADKTVENVTCARNQITLLTGPLFGGTSTGNSFNVTYNPVWNPAPITVGF